MTFESILAAMLRFIVSCGFFLDVSLLQFSKTLVMLTDLGAGQKAASWKIKKKGGGEVGKKTHPLFQFLPIRIYY